MSEKNDIVRAKEILTEGNFTCVLVKGDIAFSSYGRGVKPLLDLLDSKENYNGCYAADKVVGKAAAFLYVLLGAKALYASVISVPALELLESYEINVSYETIVEMIRNRTNTGYCPMEQATLNISEPKKALHIIKETLKKLNGA